MDSLNDTFKQLSADGTGVNLEILKGQQNFNRWARDFQAVAQAKGVWDIFDGSCVVVDPPDWDVYSSGITKTETTATPEVEGSSSKKKRKSGRATLGPDEIAKLQSTSAEGKTQTPLDLNTRLAFYKFDLDSYEKYERKSSQAMALLVTWVDPIIRGKLQSYSGPYNAFQYLKKQYKMSDVRAQELAMNRFEAIHMSKASNVQEYLNKVENARLDIVDAGGHCDEAMMTSKIIRGLTAPFYPFVDQYHFLRDIDPDNFDLTKLTTRLLTFESDIQQRAGAKTAFALQGGFNRKYPNLKCGTCKKSGHDDDHCWTTHPELKKSPEEFRAWKKAQEQKRSANRAPERIIALAQAGTSNPKPAAKRFAAMTQANVKQLHHRIEACESSNTTSTSKADPLAQAEGVKPRKEGTVKEDKHGGNKGGSCNGRSPTSKSVLPTLHVTRSNVLVDAPQAREANSMMLTHNGDQSVRHDDWILDGGANTHVVNDRGWFTDFYDFNLTVATADDGNTLEIQGGGSVEICLENSNGMDTILELSRVAYAPNVRCNILSQSALGQFGNLRGLWDKKGITIETQHGETVAEATEREGMYYLNVKKLTHTTDIQKSTVEESAPKSSSTQIMPYGAKPPLVVSAIDFNDPVWKWHRRLGHLSFENMRRLVKVSRGMNITEKQIKAKLNAICPVCATSRAINRIPREPATRRFEIVGDMIHADTWGPYGLAGIDGIKYFLALVDDAMRYTWAEPFKVKSEIGSLFRKMLNRIETGYKTKIRRIRADNEMFENDTKTWCEEKGVQIEPAVPYAHHQNGVAERNFRTERERTATMIQEHTLPKRTARIIEGLRDDMLRNCTAPERLWPEAWKHAVWLKNRTPTRALKSRKTPFELLTGHPPDLRRERVWGSRAYVTTPPEQRGTKLHEPRGWLGYFMGCESESVYRIWHPERNKVMRISMARVEDGEGMDDEQDGPSRQNRVLDLEFSPNDNLGEEREESDSGESVYEEQDDVQQINTEHKSSDETSENEEQTERDNNDGHNYDIAGEPPTENSSDDHTGDHHQDRVSNQDSSENNSDSENNSNSSSDKNNRRITGRTSRFFLANMVKRSRHDEDESDQPRRKYKQQRKHVGQPRNEKCHACLKKRVKCDGTYPFDEKCTQCRNNQRVCKTQEQGETNTVKNNGQPKDEKCHVCAKKNSRCDGTYPFDDRCTQCLNSKRICKPQEEYSEANTVDKSNQPRRNHRRGNKFCAQPKDEKCHSCFKKKAWCDGTYPFDDDCTQCLDNRRVCKPQEPTAAKRAPMKLRCRHCRRKHLDCDLKTPCSNCRTSGKECDYGTDIRRYKVDPTKERCNNCRADKLACAGEKPCNRCKKRNKNCKVQNGDIELLYTHGLGRELWEQYAEDPNTCIEC